MFKKAEPQEIKPVRPSGDQVRKWALQVLAALPNFYRCEVGEDIRINWNTSHNQEIEILYKDVPVFLSLYRDGVFRYNYGSWVDRLKVAAEEVQRQQEEQKRARFADLVEED